MKISTVKNRITNILKWTSLVVLLGCTVQLEAQTTPAAKSKVTVPTETLNGQITDITTNKPVAGVRVRTIDQRFSAMTDEQGSFAIKLPSFIHTLIISAPGYDEIEVPVYEGDKSKNIEIYPESFENYYSHEKAIFGDKRKRSVANSMRSLEPQNQPTIVVDGLLRDKMSGQILMNVNSGVPAAGSSMLIRGINSINSSNQPLVVIDGVISDNQYERSSLHLGNYFNPISGIDVNDVESVSVLKDGTSIYGSKGGNGVILINTNRGRSMATKITVSGLLGYTTRPQLTPMMNASQYRVYLSDLLKGPTAQKKLKDQFFLNTDPSFIYYNKYNNETDWTDGIYRNGTTQSYNVAVNGGDEIALYNLSIGMTNAASTLTKNDFSRINARFNSDITLSEKISTIFDISYLQANRKLRNDGVAEVQNSQVNSPGFLSLVKSPFLNPYQYSANRELTTKLDDYDFISVANPYAVLEYGSGHSQQTNFNLSVVPKFEFNKNLNITSRFAYSLLNLSENMFSPMYGVAPYIDFNNDVNSKNYVKTQFARQTSILSDTRVNWKKAANEHDYELNAGVRYVNNVYKMEYAEGHNTGSDQVREMSGSLQYKTVKGVDDPYKLLSYYGLFNYGFKDRYFAEAALNIETSSRFGNQTKSGLNLLGVSWAVFPSLNLAWLVSSEDFMQNISAINSLKLRAGIGMTGNDGIESTAARSYFKAVKFNAYATGIEINNIANPAIQWEMVTKVNAGLEASILKDRVQLNFDLFKSNTNNLLVLKNLDSYSGIANYWTNDGKLQNIGFEAGLNVQIIRTKDFNMALGASIAHYSNKITALADGDYMTKVYGAEVLTAVGQSFGQLWGYKTDGVFATAAEAAQAGLSKRESNGSLTPFGAGDVKFVDLDGNKVIDEKDKEVIGNTNPDFYGAFNAGFKYKRLSLNVMFNYSYGNDVYNFLRSQVESGSTFYNQTTAMNNRWLTEGQKTSIPRSTYGDPMENNRFSDRWVEDGSYLRLRNVELAYDIPTGKLGFLQGITVWASANNLLTLTKYLGADPEFAAGNNIYYRGIDIGLVPQSKSFNAGFKVYL